MKDGLDAMYGRKETMKTTTIGMGIFAMLLAGMATGRAQDGQPPALTDAQRDRMREWREAREDPRQGAETPAEIRRRERREQMGGGDARDLQEFRDAREQHGRDQQDGPARQRTRPTAVVPEPGPFQPQEDARAEPQRREQERQQAELAARRAVLETVMAALQDVWPQMIQRFDRDGSGHLNDRELAALLQTLQAHLHRFPAQAGSRFPAQDGN